MTHYLFHQAGSIPGIPGIFGNCRVDIDENGNLTLSPLHPILATETPLETPLPSEQGGTTTEPLGTPTEPLEEHTQEEEQAQELPAQEETPKQEETDHPHLEADIDPTPTQTEPQAQPIEPQQEATPELQPLTTEGDTN